MNFIHNDLDFYINKLKNDEKFSFTRWGDGEWSCVFGAKGHNCDRHQYFENMSKEPLEIIEIQTGTYFGEDDIIRIKDSYGREDLH